MMAKKKTVKKKPGLEIIRGKVFHGIVVNGFDVKYVGCTFIECPDVIAHTLDNCVLVNTNIRWHHTCKNCHLIKPRSSYKADMVDVVTKFLRLSQTREMQSLMGFVAAMEDASCTAGYLKTVRKLHPLRDENRNEVTRGD